jgi:DDE superfamily endonuclease
MMLSSSRKKLRQLLLVVLLIQAHNSIRRRNKLHRRALLHPKQSPWERLYTHGDSSSFLVMTGLSRTAFQELSSVLFQDNNQQPILRRGRPELLDCNAQLGLYLFFIGSTMGIKHLCLIFGVVPSVCSKVINSMVRLVVKKLKNHPLAKVRFPDADKMALFAQLIQGREPSVDDVIGFLDGLSLASECSSEVIEQNAMYNGYHSDTMVNNIFAYGPDGKVFLCAINFPGSWHDGSLTSNVFPYIRDNIGCYKICVDQGFPRSGDAAGILVGPISKKQARTLAPNLRPYLLKISNVYTSLRQASEWGMRSLQGTFPRCKKRLPSNAAKRKKVIQSIVLIHNFRTELVGLNQIKTVFDPEYERYINVRGYDRIKRYYFNEDDNLDQV